MKFNKSSQLLLVSAASLLVAGFVTACSTATTDFVFVSSSLAAGPNSYGEIDVFEINVVSGFMRQIQTSPFPSGGRDPVAEAVTSDYSTLYVVNQLDNNIVQFQIGPDGKLYPLNTVNTPGIYPLAVAVNGTSPSPSMYLYVVDTFQSLGSCSLASPCSGSIGVFPIEPASGSGSTAIPAGALGPPIVNPSINASYWPLINPNSTSDVMVPTAVTVLPGGAYVYVTAYDSAAVTANNEGSVNICDLNASAYAGAVGYVYGFSVGSAGALTAIPGSPFAISGSSSQTGSLPCGIASDSSGGHVYVTDYVKGEVFGFSVASGTGSLSPIAGSPFGAGNQPKSIAVDPNYSYAYVANTLDGTVSAYSIGGSGALNSLGTPYDAGLDPVAIGIDPSTSHFVFTANFLGSNVSDFEMSTTAGTLINAQLSPYKSNAQPTAVVAVPNSGGPK